MTVPMLEFVRSSLWPRIPTLRIPSVTRIGLDRILEREFARLEAGEVLDVGAKGSPYAARIPATRYLTLDVDRRSHPDICCDIHELDWPGESFDTVVALEVLEHLHDPQRAVDRVRHVLRPGGTCIASTRFFYRYHPDPKDYYRFTWDSLEQLFRAFAHVEIHHHGNRLHTLWELINAGGRSRVDAQPAEPRDCAGRVPADVVSAGASSSWPGSDPSRRHPVQQIVDDPGLSVPAVS